MQSCLRVLHFSTLLKKINILLYGMYYDCMLILGAVFFIPVSAIATASLSPTPPENTSPPPPSYFEELKGIFH